MATLTVGLSDLPAAIANAHAGDIITAKPGTILNPLPLLTANNVSLYLDGVTLRAVLTPYTWPIERGQVAAMAFLGLTGSYVNLTSDQKKAVQAASVPASVSTATDALIASYVATLAPIKDSRMWDANPVRLGQITYNGLNIQIPIHWRSTVSKGIITAKIGVWGTYIHGGIFQNARMEGSSYNAAGVRVQASSDLWVEGTTFQDCEDGILAGGATVTNPNGEWYQDGPPDRLDFFGFNVDKDCIYDNCGAPQTGRAHARYGNDCLYNVSIRPKSIRANGGHFIKFHGGLQICLGGDFEDDGSPSGVEQCVDMDGGAGYIINCIATKNSRGNDGAPVMMRNGREPIPSSFENVFVVKGNVITYTPNHVSWFVNSMNEPAFVNANDPSNIWPGVPRSIRTIVDGNVFRAPAGMPVLRTPVNAPAGSVVQNNQIIGMADPIPDVKIALSDYQWTRASLVADVSDLVSKVDPDAKFLPWLTAKPLYPVGVSISFPEAQEDPAVIAQLQADKAALQAQVADLQSQLAAAQNVDATDQTQIGTLTQQLAAAQAVIAAVRSALPPSP